MTASVTSSLQSKVHLSPTEKKLVGLLSVGKATDTKALALRYYEPTEIPHNGQIVVANIVRSLERKTAKGTPYVIKRGERNGPHPMSVIMEKRK